MIDGRDKVVWVSEAKGAMTNQFDLVVHPLQGSIGYPEFGPGQKTWKVIFNQFGEFDD